MVRSRRLSVIQYAPEVPRFGSSEEAICQRVSAVAHSIPTLEDSFAMVRTLAVTAAVTAAVGFAVGWLAFSKTDQGGSAKAPLRTPTATTPRVSPGEPRPDAAGVVAVIQRFALRPGDLSADRETPAVAVAPDGAVVLAWASQEQDGDNLRTLYLTRSTDGGGTFDTPAAWRSVPIYRYTSGNPAREGKMAFSTHVLPRLAATRDSVALGWVEAIDGGPTVQFLVARSHDGGKTFAAPVATHGKNASRPGFTTLAVDSDGGLACGWLSNQQPYFSSSPAGSEGFTPEQLVFAGPEGKGICPCCDVAVAVTPERTALVAFRNSDSGHRDIWLARGAAAGIPGRIVVRGPCCRDPGILDLQRLPARWPEPGPGGRQAAPRLDGRAHRVRGESTTQSGRSLTRASTPIPAS